MRVMCAVEGIHIKSLNELSETHKLKKNAIGTIALLHFFELDGKEQNEAINRSKVKLEKQRLLTERFKLQKKIGELDEEIKKLEN